MNILGIGETVIDRVELDDNDKRTLHEDLHVGGPVTAALVVLARLGASCHYLTSIGRDAEAKLITELVEQEGISATFTHQHATKVNTMVVNSKTGQRTKLRSDVQHEPIASIPLELVQSADLIIVDRHEPQAFTEVMQHKRRTTQIIIDPSTEVSAYTRTMMRLAEHPIVPIESLTQLGAKDIPTALANLYALCQKPVVVTLGDLGSLIYDGHDAELVAPMDVQAIDTTGAGDVYRGAYGYGMLQGWDRYRAATFANAVAGMQCTHMGNISAIPPRERLLELAQLPAANTSIELDDIHAHYARLMPQSV